MGLSDRCPEPAAIRPRAWEIVGMHSSRKPPRHRNNSYPARPGDTARPSGVLTLPASTPPHQTQRRLCGKPRTRTTGLIPARPPTSGSPGPDPASLLEFFQQVGHGVVHLPGSALELINAPSSMRQATLSVSLNDTAERDMPRICAGSACSLRPSPHRHGHSLSTMYASISSRPARLEEGRRIVERQPLAPLAFCLTLWPTSRDVVPSESPTSPSGLYLDGDGQPRPTLLRRRRRCGAR